ncbi:PSPA7_2676 family Cys-rich small protein [Pseudomonas sp. F(2018)]|uniref:PSPA7_2676 family Cys-rich small protein n=1 Tax=Pseudomonas sp. F(2018) TaxID=2502240 RepID=UPI0010F8B72B|nr:PSPA7_2676 family Cys-rich small protein [Pseudomonas sp. F(2018)]
MTMLCLISGCQWFPDRSAALRLCGSELLHECCSRCGTRRYLLPGERQALLSVRPGQQLPWS